MNIEEFRNYCLQKPCVSEEFPFDEVTLVLKVAGKIFALCGLEEPDFKVNLKCEPSYAEELREIHSEIQPGWHMNKKHWNTISFQGGLSNQFLKKLIDHSYEQVIKTIPKKKKEEFGL